MLLSLLGGNTLVIVELALVFYAKLASAFW
jgi:hypothetical protein